MLLVSSGKPEGMAAALTWMGRHLGEMLWRFSVSMEVDALREQLGNADSETLFNRADSCRHRG